MKIIFSTIGFLISCVFLWPACGNVADKDHRKEETNRRITLAVAANMQFVIGELTQTFQEQTGIACELVISSSGKLTAQIAEGAPYDVLVSADMKYPNEILSKGLAATPPKVYGRGKLALWSMVEGFTPSLESLTDETVKHIALANPKTAPYGIAAVEVLKNHQLLDKVENKLVYGESISQTNQFITSRSAEVGFTSLSVVLSAEMKGKGNWIALDIRLYPPIEQGVVVIQRKDGPVDQAKKFYDFLSSEEARKVLTAYGYEVEGI